jgi:hypothetical protein
MATADDVNAELLGTNDPPGHHACVMFENGPAGLGGYVAFTLQDKVSHAAHEVTLWLPRRALKDQDLAPSNPRKMDTTLGHAIDAASFGRINAIILTRVVAALKAKGFDIDISDLSSE